MTTAATIGDTLDVIDAVNTSSGWRTGAARVQNRGAQLLRAIGDDLSNVGITVDPSVRQWLDVADEIGRTAEPPSLAARLDALDPATTDAGVLGDVIGQHLTVGNLETRKEAVTAVAAWCVERAGDVLAAGVDDIADALSQQAAPWRAIFAKAAADGLTSTITAERVLADNSRSTKLVAAWQAVQGAGAKLQQLADLWARAVVLAGYGAVLPADTRVPEDREWLDAAAWWFGKPSTMPVQGQPAWEPGRRPNAIVQDIAHTEQAVAAAAAHDATARRRGQGAA